MLLNLWFLYSVGAAKAQEQEHQYTERMLLGQQEPTWGRNKAQLEPVPSQHPATSLIAPNNCQVYNRSLFPILRSSLLKEVHSHGDNPQKAQIHEDRITESGQENFFWNRLRFCYFSSITSPSNNKEKTNHSLVSGWLKRLYPRHKIPSKTIF